MMVGDEGMTFHVVIQLADGETISEATTDHRLELLTWIDQHQRAGDTVVEVSTTARGPAVRKMLAALTFGAANLSQKAVNDDHRNRD